MPMDRVVHRLVLESEAMEMDAAEFRQLAAEAIAQAVRAQTPELESMPSSTRAPCSRTTASAS
jgi:hypothetical protein